MPKVKRPEFLEKKYKRRQRLSGYMIDRDLKQNGLAKQINVSVPTATRRYANPEDLTVRELYLMKLTKDELYDLVNGL